MMQSSYTLTHNTQIEPWQKWKTNQPFLIAQGWDSIRIWKDIEFTLLGYEWLNSKYIAIAFSHGQWGTIGNVSGKYVISIYELLSNCVLIDDEETIE